jgi:S-adenosylmethionine decarboxylase
MLLRGFYAVLIGIRTVLVLNSESSFFVWPHKIILKTCGTTTLLLGLDSLLNIAREYCGMEQAWRCFYSRKTFMFPERQMGPHKKWEDEVKFLDETFSELPMSKARSRVC